MDFVAIEYKFGGKGEFFGHMETWYDVGPITETIYYGIRELGEVSAARLGGYLCVRGDGVVHLTFAFIVHNEVSVKMETLEGTNFRTKLAKDFKNTTKGRPGNGQKRGQ